MRLFLALLAIIAALLAPPAAKAQDRSTEGGSVFVPSGEDFVAPPAEIVLQMENVSIAFFCALQEAHDGGADMPTAEAIARGRLGWTTADDRALLAKHAASGGRPSGGPCTELPPVIYTVRPEVQPEGDPGSGTECGDGMEWYTATNCRGTWYQVCYEDSWHPSAWGHQWRYLQWNPWNGLCYIQCLPCIFDNIN